MDKEYWSKYYKVHKNPDNPSPFAVYIEKYLSPGKTLLELGCGNARDAVYFSNKGVKVTGLDQVSEEIAYLNRTYSNENLKFLVKDFTNIRKFDDKFDFIYSRFTLHAITERQEDDVLSWAYRHLNPNGLFLLEVRSVKDELYNKGKVLESEKNARITTHYRRFDDFDELVGKFKKLGFEIVEALEGKNFAIYKNENPVVIRMVVRFI